MDDDPELKPPNERGVSDNILMDLFTSIANVFGDMNGVESGPAPGAQRPVSID